MKWGNYGFKTGFIGGVFSILLILGIILFANKIRAELQKSPPNGHSENNGVTMGTIPLDYGVLKAVTGDASKGIYFLWLEDAKGTIRAVGVTRGVVSDRVTHITRE